jgi:ubiquinone/menaquinone biosynthesis C-methylase UbiE
MPQSSDQHYLLTHQYKNASNLRARIQLHERFSTNTYDWQHWVFDHFTIPPHAHILELGCGPGELWRRNLHRIPEHWHITLSDLSPGMLQEAQQHLQDSYQHFSFQVIDAQSIPFANEHFDAVIANHMLYHVPDLTKALSEIRRVLKPGGRFYAATNGHNHLRELQELVNKFDPNVPGLWAMPSLPFRLENGGQELSHQFSHVTLHRYEDALVITEAEPLVAYVLSTPLGALIVDDKVAEFTRFVEQELAALGAIHISKDSGLFEAF